MTEAQHFLATRRRAHVAAGWAAVAIGVTMASFADPFAILWGEEKVLPRDLLSFMSWTLFALAGYALGVKPALRLRPGGIEVINPLRSHLVAAEDVIDLAEVRFVYPCLVTTAARIPIFALEVTHRLPDGRHPYVKDVERLVAASKARAGPDHRATTSGWRRPDVVELGLAAALLAYLLAAALTG